MKLQPKSNLISRLLPLIGAVIFLIALPVTAQAQPVPDLSVTKVCANGPLQSVLCTVTVTNLGTVPSVSPLKLTDLVTGAPTDALFTGGGGTLPISCSPGAGPVLPIACSANIALLPNQAKTALFSFKLPTGGSFTNCATVTQQNAAGTLLDPNPANNTNICTTITVPPPSGGGPITIVTPPPSGACTSQTVVSGLHYPAQSCAQSTPGFLAGMMTSFHFKSKCPAGTQLLGVTNVTCQNAPIPGFPTGSVYQGTACCGIVAPPVPDLGVKKTCQVFTNSGQPPAATCTVTVTNFNSTVPAVLPITLKDTITGPNPAMLTGAGGTLNPSGPGPANVNGVLTTFTGNTPLAGGTSGTMLISYNFPSGGGTYTNCATVSQAQPDPIPANNTNVCTTFTVPSPASTACANPTQSTLGCRFTVTVKRTQGPAIYKVAVSPIATAPTPNIAPSTSGQCTINGGPAIPQTTCWFNYNTDPQIVTLTASSSAGPLPATALWSGACTHALTTPCTRTVTQALPQTVTANFP